MTIMSPQPDVDKTNAGGAGSQASHLHGGAAMATSVEPFKFANAGGLTDEVEPAVRALHEEYARNLARALGSHLETEVQCSLQALEQLPAEELFTKAAGTEAYYLACRVAPLDSLAVFQIDTRLAFRIFDILLGGTGASNEGEIRDLTEVEEYLMGRVASILREQLEELWRRLGLGVRLDRRISRPELERLLPATGKLFFIQLQAKLQDVEGRVGLILSSPVASRMVRTLSKELRCARQAESQRTQPTVPDRLLNCTFNIELGIPDIRVPARELLALAPGSVVGLNLPVRSPAYVMIAGRTAFEANPVRTGRMRAAQVGKRTGQTEWNKELP